MKLSKKISLLITLLICFESQSQNINDYDFENFLNIPKFLSEYGFFKDLKNQIPVEDVHPYSLKSALFSDETDKLRFVFVPKGKKVGYVKNKVFVFPIGSVLIKTFAYLNNNGPLEAELLETRLLINTNDGWQAISYVWSEDQTDAKRAIAGAIIPTKFVKSSGEIINIRYRAPNQNQCKECHQLKKVMTPIGPKARNMDKLVQYETGEMNQLVYWAALGWINKNLGSSSISNYAGKWFKFKFFSCESE